jgi:hypothetical protein
MATTGYSAPILRICTFILAGFPLGFFHWHRSRRFPRSEQKPVSRSRRLHAGHHLDSKQVSSRLVPGQRFPPGFDDVPTLSTLYQPLTCVRLRSTYLTESCSAFSLTLTTAAFDRSSLRWFEASACTAASKGPPSSSVQHCLALTRRAFVAHNHLRIGLVDALVHSSFHRVGEGRCWLIMD